MKRRVIRSIGIVSAGAVLSTAAGTLADVPCEDCGPGDHWVDTCPGGDDSVDPTEAVVGLDLNLDCVANTSLILKGPTTIRRNAGVPHTIDTEIVSMSLAGGGVTLTAGAGLGQGGVLPPSLGTIVEQPNPEKALADSSFDVFFEVYLGAGVFAYNHTALRIEAKINCVPPDTTYIHPTGCLPLYDDPVAGTVVANLVSAQHRTFPNGKGVPTLSEWGLVSLVVLTAIGGAVIVRRHRAGIVSGSE